MVHERIIITEKFDSITYNAGTTNATSTTGTNSTTSNVLFTPTLHQHTEPTACAHALHALPSVPWQYQCAIVAAALELRPCTREPQQLPRSSSAVTIRANH